MLTNLAAHLSIDPDDHEPLSTQIFRGILDVMIHRDFEGDLPSPFQLARELRVAPSSIRHAYQDLVQAGLLDCRDFRYSAIDHSQ